MKRATKTFLFASFILVGFGFGTIFTKANSGDEAIENSRFYSQYPDFNPVELSTRFQVEIDRNKLLKPLYVATEYNLIWVKDTLNTKKIGELVSILSDVDKHGLSKQTFPTEKIIAIVRAIDSGQYANDLTKLYEELIQLEELASTSAMKYAVGMRFGFLNPKTLYGRSYAIAVDKASNEYYAQLYTSLSADAIQTMLVSEPESDEYRALVAEYRKLDKLKDMRFSKIPSKGKAMYKAFDRGDNVVKIAQRLALTGEYTIQDTMEINPSGYILDTAMLNAVNEFRRRNSYFEESDISDPAIEALNRPITYYQDKVKANLERYRWRRTKGTYAKHIEVNIASQMLIVTENGKPALEMRVAVGSLKNKTPLLQSDIAYINLNPVWNVPRSIATKELSLKQKNNSSYFKNNKIKVYKAGKEIDASSVDWGSVSPDNFAYSIKQTPGDHNALGKIKFMFNNNFAVYLHDTPSKAAFNKQNRAVSHGCIRLQRPIDLALFLSNPAKDASYTDRLYHSIDLKAPSAEGQRLQAEKKLSKLDDIIRMNEQISLFIDYYTVYLKPQDKTIYYADDIYQYDKPILDGLAKLGGRTIEVKKPLLAEN